MPKRPYPRWQRRHEGVLIWLLRHPWGKLHDCARETGYTPSHISRIVNSPEFFHRYAAAAETIKSDAAAHFLLMHSRWSMDKIRRFREKRPARIRDTAIVRS